MAAGYKTVTWTPFKVRYDLWMIAGIAIYLGVFFGVAGASQPPGESFAPVQLAIRATGTLAFLMLTFVLAIGPLARLSARFKPVLYNRRHLGVATFTIALVHGGLVLLWYHGFSEMNVLVSLFVSNPRYDSISGFPFESLGFIALILLAVMATTSHDFWNANLGPGLWKALHMGVYVAYALLVAHVALGVLQDERHPAYLAALAGGAGLVTVLHLIAGLFASGATRPAAIDDGWLEVAPFADIPDTRALVLAPPAGERIAVFRHGSKVAAVSNVCRHQGGPLGEGKVVDGCITCPWHGFQYRMEDGRSPAPYTEMVSTYPTRIENGVVYVSTTPNPPGTAQPPSTLAEAIA